MSNSSEGALSQDAKAKLAAALGSSSQHAEQADQGDSQDTYAGVVRIVDQATGIEAQELTRDARIHEDLNIDSLSIVDIAVRVEDAFGVRVEESDIHDAETLGDLVDLIDELIAAQ
ncbi:acyl carrier protein [Corynebacterium sp. zg254]|uniref:Acyl carrier protein n=1 Tax=Corynebacterium zhongnanshanii TaxID=2768834 RepID=A0ABQ6VDJ7_9CORY|nr:MULTISPECIES: phosphopantetheine-binding protein [Corynebacterium]KAB3520881.1 acyl carrier protein [Corynebacterium zhongnanshanii]MCR5914509.1 acyl carrier protein [Corynebacterium sp. zg254]